MIRIAVCDDNIEELNYVDHILQNYCHEQYSCLDVQTFRTGFSLLNAIECGMSFDIVLLDIIMPGENGIDIAREIRKNDTQVKLLFLTSSVEYAVESYEVRASNYIVKPISAEKLCRIIAACISDIEQKEQAGLILRTGSNQYMRVQYSRLMYGEAMRKTVDLHLSDQSVVSSVMTFTKLVSLLEGHVDFVKPHRSYIVNLHYIEHINKNEIIMTNGDRIPIPPKKYPEVSKLFFDFSFHSSFGKERNDEK